jgi:subtilisin family serine protease
MKKLMKKPSMSFTFFTILVVCNVSMVGAKYQEEEKTPYIVHMSKSQMPASFDHHFHWYESTLKSVSTTSKIIYAYEDAIHGFSTSLTPTEARLMSSQTGILKVLPDKKYKLLTTRTPEFLGLGRIPDMFPASSSSSRRMEDVIVGVIDTGVWPESKSFDDTGYGPIPATWKGKCETGTDFTVSNCNKKLIGARFFLKGYESDKGSPINETKESRSPRDTDGHGTHTTSIAVGSPVRNASLFGYAAGTARGMSPGARVAIYKVCWEGAGCLGSDYLAAIDQAIIDKVNVLSLSLGFIPLNYTEDPLAIGAFAAMEHGILVSCGGGNSGPDASLITNIAPWITTVGAGTLDRDFPAYIRLGNRKRYSGLSLYDDSGSFPDTLVSFIYAGNASINGEKKCEPDTLVKEKVVGKIVMCDSGLIPEVEKGYLVKSLGGLGMVLALDGDELVAEPHILPTIVVNFKAGEAIKKYLFYSDPNKSKAAIVFGRTKLGVQPSPLVAMLSSRGPNSITSQILKPDVIAPGLNILAAFTRKASPTNEDWDPRRVDFNIYSGTSMACPHVSGIAAIIKSIHPDWSPAAIRSALMTTAYTAYENGKTLLDNSNKKPATPFDFGAGHVDPVLALNPGLVYDLTVDDYLSFLCALNYSAADIEIVVRRKFTCDRNKHYSVANLNYPSFAVVFEGGHGMEEIKHTRTLTNVGVAGTYKVSIKSDAPFVKISVEPEVLSFKTKEKKLYTITFTTSGSKPNSSQSFGSVEWSNGKTTVRSPIAFSWKLQ